MKSLLLVAHGSRRKASNDEIRALTERLGAAEGVVGLLMKLCAAKLHAAMASRQTRAALADLDQFLSGWSSILFQSRSGGIV